MQTLLFRDNLEAFAAFGTVITLNVNVRHHLLLTDLGSQVFNRILNSYNETNQFY